MNNYPDIELDIEKAGDFLDLQPSRLTDLIEKRNLLQNWDEYDNMYRFEGHAGGIPSGSVLIDNGSSFKLIRGFPKIRRAMLLEPSIKVNFSGIDSVVVEEKMNGYNVRVVEYDDELIAFTRSGHVCPYTTERIQNFLERDFFRDNPDIVVYGEMVGPENPYVQKSVYNVESLDFFVFDMRYKDTGDALSVFRRREMAEVYGLKQVMLFGNFPLEKAAEKVKEIIKAIGKEGREGVMIKDPDMVLQPVKYTCSESNCSDLQHAFRFYNESGKDFLFSRVVREGFQTHEWDENEEEFHKRCLRLGKSMLGPMRDTIAHVSGGERISDDFSIRVKDREVIDRFITYLERLGLDLLFDTPHKSGNEYIINIRKINKSTSDKTQALLEGQLWS